MDCACILNTDLRCACVFCTPATPGLRALTEIPRPPNPLDPPRPRRRRNTDAGIPSLLPLPSTCEITRSSPSTMPNHSRTATSADVMARRPLSSPEVSTTTAAP
ncbi:hypothetical protein Vafri_9821 [Volvox africanus]|uniref:Uncharacterized protein n=1 Tax=Volvox africanus TaxID=51714 RepID=A0A8J4B521_9CHLO|nr:hypothetical protein Vafri_9821 [Volvox africanus]